MRRVELVYDANCPNVDLARSALVEALAQVGFPEAWAEWERHDPKAPSYVRLYGSPTILVDGRDVVPQPTSAGEGCCRLYEAEAEGLRGAPPVTVILSALERNDQGRRWPALLAAFPGALAVALPSCPFCWPLYAGAVSTLGAGFLLDQKYMAPLAAILLLLTLALLRRLARARHRYRLLWVGTAGAGAILAGKFVWSSTFLIYAGSAAILGALLWNIRSQGARQCSRCENP